MVRAARFIASKEFTEALAIGRVSQELHVEADRAGGYSSTTDRRMES